MLRQEVADTYDRINVVDSEMQTTINISACGLYESIVENHGPLNNIIK